MNKKGGSGLFGMALLLAFFIFFVVLMATIEPIKEALDSARDTTSLNCPGTLTFNQTDYDDDSRLDKLTKRPTCFATGLTMVYFIGAFLIASVVWVVSNWKRIAK